ncbi:PIN domain-containing protein [Nocardia sp. CS682]|uniref:PIN domain-containing protein n=1 Tax=Nocardia sp. CS682 TaxID=1047172 RepID=UPI001074BDDE|nr:PIN domain-containing protein [Nocardia sp. CS682]QBS40377.1 VapC toxin family PIN domain ribonuclease [Nocardia sp. CS682]
MIVIADTSGLVAAFNKVVREHVAAKRSMQRAALVVASPLILHEIEYIITRDLNRSAAHGINDWILAQEHAGRFLVPGIGSGLIRKARRIQHHYMSLCLDLADALNVVLAAEFETNTVLTLDRRDFRAIRPLTGAKAFHLLPDDR